MKNIIVLLLLLNTGCAFAQSSSKIYRELGSPILIDSTGIFLIPIVYKSVDGNSNLYINGFYSNIVIRRPDSSKNEFLFERETFIHPIRNGYNYNVSLKYGPSVSNSSSHAVFFVKNIDLNKNGRIDRRDPDVIYIASLDFTSLNQLTPRDMNVLNYTINEKNNQILVQLQLDSNHDGSFTDKDEKSIYILYDLNTCKELQRIAL